MLLHLEKQSLFGGGEMGFHEEEEKAWRMVDHVNTFNELVCQALLLFSSFPKRYRNIVQTIVTRGVAIIRSVTFKWCETR